MIRVIYIYETTFDKDIKIFNTNQKKSKISVNMIFLMVCIVGLHIFSKVENRIIQINKPYLFSNTLPEYI
jgi:hypothetical protein